MNGVDDFKPPRIPGSRRISPDGEPGGVSDAARLLAALLVATAAVGGLAAAAGDARADHGGEANYTVVPRDRQPGSDDATYSQFAVSPRDVDYLDYIAATWYDGGFTGCGPSNAEVFGIDRGTPTTATGSTRTSRSTSRRARPARTTSGPTSTSATTPSAPRRT